jgi:hypothetical protein
MVTVDDIVANDQKTFSDMVTTWVVPAASADRASAAQISASAARRRISGYSAG